MTPKERAAELVAKLRDAAALHDPLARAAIELLKITVDEAKESLVAATDHADMLRLQGGVKTLQKLHKELTTQPPNIIKTTE